MYKTCVGCIRFAPDTIERRRPAHSIFFPRGVISLKLVGFVELILRACAKEFNLKAGVSSFLVHVTAQPLCTACTWDLLLFTFLVHMGHHLGRNRTCLARTCEHNEHTSCIVTCFVADCPVIAPKYLVVTLTGRKTCVAGRPAGRLNMSDSTV